MDRRDISRFRLACGVHYYEKAIGVLTVGEQHVAAA
jgi:hypothetical protein